MVHTQELLNDYVEKLKAIYATNLDMVIIYGSYARGDYTDDSDIDIMILLKADVDWVHAKDKELIYMTYDFNFANDIDIQPFAQSRDLFYHWRNAHPFYKNVSAEGVVIYNAA